MFRFIFHIFKKNCSLLSLIFVSSNIKAQAYYVSSSQGNDQNNGLSVQSPFKSIEKLNSINFNAGDSIYFNPVIIGKVCFG